MVQSPLCPSALRLAAACPFLAYESRRNYTKRLPHRYPISELPGTMRPKRAGGTNNSAIAALPRFQIFAGGEGTGAPEDRRVAGNYRSYRRAAGNYRSYR